MANWAAGSPTRRSGNWCPTVLSQCRTPLPLPRETVVEEPSLCWRYRSCAAGLGLLARSQTVLPTARVPCGSGARESAHRPLLPRHTASSNWPQQVGVLGVRTRCWPRPACLISAEKLDTRCGRRSSAVITRLVASPPQTLGSVFPQLPSTAPASTPSSRRRLSDCRGLCDAATAFFGSQQPQI